MIVLRAFRCASFACLVATSASAAWAGMPPETGNRSAEWQWQPVDIGAGGFIRGMLIHPLDNTVRYARTDTWGAYRWDASQSRWINMVGAHEFTRGTQVGSSAAPGQAFPLTGFPASGGVDSIAVDPRSTKTVYMAMSVSPPGDITNNVQRTGNVYWSRDGGQVFHAATGLSLPSYANPACNAQELDGYNTEGERLRVDPSDSRVVYLGSELNGLFVSADAGRSFAPLNASGAPGQCQPTVNVLFDSSHTVSRVLNGVSVTVSATIYVVVNGAAIAGVYRSGDGGATFTNIASGQAAIAPQQVGGSAIDSSGAFWITASGQVLRWSAGAWTQSSPQHGGGGIAVDPGNPNRVFVTDGGLSVSRSTDGGASWADLGAYTSITSGDGIAWITARKIHPTAHGPLLFDPQVPTGGGTGRLWVPEGNDGILHTDLDDAAQPGGGVNTLAWTELSRGIEQLVGQNIVIPSGGGNAAVVATEDESLFYVSNPQIFDALHFDVNTSTEGNNDLSSNGMVAYVPDAPAVMVNISSNLFSGAYRGGPFLNNFASYSTNYGQHWQLLPSIQLVCCNNSYGTGSIINTPIDLVGGQIAISTRGSVLPGAGQPVWTGHDDIAWFPFGSQYSPFGASNIPPYFSTDGGASWNVSTVYDQNGKIVDFNTNPFQLIFVNASKQFAVVADPVIPLTFYAATVSNFMASVDGGATFHIPPGGAGIFAPADGFFINAQMAAVPGRAGDLWFTTGNGAPGAAGYLFHSTNGGQAWQRLALTKVYNVAIGRSAKPGTYALYIYGQPSVADPFGVYRSDDTGTSWYRISGPGGYPIDSFNTPSVLAASPDVDGLIYVSFGGMGYAWAYRKSAGDPYPEP